MQSQPTFVPLSASALWQRQRAYFEAQGPRAWSTGAVPHYVTSNPEMARALAEVAIGFATDRARGLAPPDGLRPLYLLELGAGAGRLGFHLTRVLAASVELAALGWRPVYVLSDLAEETVAWWQTRPGLAALASAGLLDFARFDVERDDAVVLRRSGVRLDRANPAGELIVIANYVFDSLPHDVFEDVGGELREWMVAEPDDAPAPGAPIERAAAAWSMRVAPRPRYRDPVHERVLDQYRDRRGCFTVPGGALAALDRVRGLCAGPMLVLSADKGDVALDDVVGEVAPHIACHGSVSMAVNYHAIGAWTRAHGGTWMHADHHGRALETCAFVLGAGGARAWSSTVAAFDRAIARRSPDDFHALKRILVAQAGAMTLCELLAYLRLSGHDPVVFLACADAIARALPAAEPAHRADLRRALARVWDSYLPIGEDDDVAFAIGRLYLALGEPALALPLLEASRALDGDQAALADLLIKSCRRAAVRAPWEG